MKIYVSLQCKLRVKHFKMNHGVRFFSIFLFLFIFINFKYDITYFMEIDNHDIIHFLCDLFIFVTSGFRAKTQLVFPMKRFAQF